ncbi:MAG: enoyl-CoA hydratase/isomerase family protein, partial [Pseudomonas sp.]|uniref:enoyl-CoA hydratase/isomerase family protein n=1 Tax=Pseudomonas sp. TaxID=306 RepID=UPI00391C7A57
MNTLLLESHNGVLHITLNRPECRNAMSLQMVNELHAALAQLDSQVRAVVISGAGGHFCAGADVKDMVSAGDQLATLNRAFGALLQAVEALPQVVIVVLQGAVLGGGFGL